MATNIQWCDETFNSHRGCSKVNTGCRFCYAEHSRPVIVHGTKWGTEKQGGTRTVAAGGTWKDPARWNRMDFVECCGCGHRWDCKGHRETFCPACGYPEAREARPRVFVGSLMDWAEDWQGIIVNHNQEQLFHCHGCDRWSISQHEDCPCGTIESERVARPLTMTDVRRRLLAMPKQFPNLDFLFLTKRPENVSHMVVEDAPTLWNSNNNVWLGTSVANQETADQAIPELLKCRDLAKYLFLSVEPLVGPVNLQLNGINWVIVGGESGSKARPCNVDWVRAVVRQCDAAGVPCFVKQLGANVVDPRADGSIHSQIDETECWPDSEDYAEKPTGHIWWLNHRKGGEPAEWPEDLRRREFPDVD